MPTERPSRNFHASKSGLAPWRVYFHRISIPTSGRFERCLRFKLAVVREGRVLRRHRRSKPICCINLRRETVTLPGIAISGARAQFSNPHIE